MTKLSQKKKFFGTDGVRGHANQAPITPDIILKLAQAAGHRFTRGDHRHSVVIGKDTRLSGYMVESSLTAGFVSMGMDVILVGPLPTPAVALLTRSLRADLGVMISASHNPYQDNGIKFFGPDGFKLTDTDELEIESLMTTDLPLAHPSQMGKARRLEDAAGRYIEFAKSTFPRALRLDGIKIVVDCAHGAAYKVAPKIFWELGAQVITIGASPDGCNINEGCGATSLDLLKQAVVDHEADLGIALDGDADRLIIVDEKGTVLDGDQLLGLLATSWHEDGDLKGSAIVATQMSNLGLERYLSSLGIKLIRSAVGDRYVLEEMRKHGCNIGGEQSGHMIFTDYTTTGDGIIAALQVLSLYVQTEKKMSQIGHLFTPVPQVLKSIRTSNFQPLLNDSVQQALKKAEGELSALNGRLLVRRSGTEPLIRVMAEGDSLTAVTNIVDDILKAIQQADQKAAA